jgi:hypothetical protein
MDIPYFLFLSGLQVQPAPVGAALSIQPDSRVEEIDSGVKRFRRPRLDASRRRFAPALEEQVEGRQHNQGEQRRGKKTPNYDNRQRHKQNWLRIVASLTFEPKGNACLSPDALSPYRRALPNKKGPDLHPALSFLQSLRASD